MSYNHLTRVPIYLVSKRIYPLQSGSIRVLSSSTSNHTASDKSKLRTAADGKKKSKEMSRPQNGEKVVTNAKSSNPATVLTAPRSLPTRHSRHSTPPVAPRDILHVESQKLLDAPPGILFAYNSKNLQYDKVAEYEQGLVECHVLQQKVEYLLRGYSSMIPGCLVNLQSETVSLESDTRSGENYDDVIFNMIQLVERIELEGQAYVELRSKYRSQLARISTDHNQGEEKEEHKEDHHDQEGSRDSLQDDEEVEDETEEFIVDESTDNNAWRMNALVTHYGAPPGPTNQMYDLILDAIAVSVGSSSHPLLMIQHSRSLYNKSLKRYEMDAQEGMDQLNPTSCPTPLTFNAVIRAAAISTHDEQVRDYAMENAFCAFNAMYHHPVVHRNSATYRYMLEMMEVLFPVGAMRGNISAAMWQQAVQEKVVDLALLETMKRMSNQSHGELFDEWWKKVEGRFVRDVNGYGFPLVWGRNKNVRKYDRKSEAY
mmetsp:Transcript_16209/g.30651  ORF Transcript_16209/g.30651 Transcript_16209/m.30651 type:complete len:485 (+) Transcript_16209:81-1535(+)